MAIATREEDARPQFFALFDRMDRAAERGRNAALDSDHVVAVSGCISEVQEGERVELRCRMEEKN